MPPITETQRDYSDYWTLVSISMVEGSAPTPFWLWLILICSILDAVASGIALWFFCLHAQLDPLSIHILNLAVAHLLRSVGDALLTLLSNMPFNELGGSHSKCDLQLRKQCQPLFHASY